MELSMTKTHAAAKLRHQDAAASCCYKPGSDFELDKNQALLDSTPTDSTELWLIQLPLHQLQPSDFNGKEIKLKEHHDNLLGEFESLSGKSYEMTISGDKDLDAAAYIAPGLFKSISRTVRLVHYPEPEEFEKTRGLSTINLSTQKTAGSMRKTTKYSTPMKNSTKISHETLVSAPKSGQGSVGSSHIHNKKKHEGTNESQASGSKSEISKSEKKKIKVEE